MQGIGALKTGAGPCAGDTDGTQAQRERGEVVLEVVAGSWERRWDSREDEEDREQGGEWVHRKKDGSRSAHGSLDGPVPGSSGSSAAMSPIPLKGAAASVSRA
jgi:hypothetical protein